MTDEVIITDPHRNFGKPMFAASGACVDAVMDRLVAGESLASVAADFELTGAEVGYCEERFIAFFSKMAEAAKRAREVIPPITDDGTNSELVLFLRRLVAEQNREILDLRQRLDVAEGWSRDD